MPLELLARALGKRPGASQGFAQVAGTARETVQQALCDSARRRRPPLGRAVRAVVVVGVLEQHRQQVAVGVAVDERRMGLGEQREAPLRQPVDEPQLPERLAAVEAAREQLGEQSLEVLAGALAWQRALADVEVQLEVRVIDPRPRANAPGSLDGALAVAGYQVQPRAHLLAQAFDAGRCALEDEGAAGVHVQRPAVLDVEQARFGGGELVHIVRIGTCAWGGPSDA